MAAKIRAEVLNGRWLHSHEEDSEGEMVFRPAGWEFPPARGRTGFELRPDGSLVRIGIGPADAPVRTAGRWKLDGNTLLLLPAHEAGAEARRALRLVSASRDRLVVRKEA